jgi:hypothetical protein
MASQISESDTDTKDNKSEGKEVEGKTPGQESLVSVGSTRKTLIAVPVIEVPHQSTSQHSISDYNYIPLHSITNNGTL